MPPVAECQHFLCSKGCFPRRYKNYADYIHGVHRPGKHGKPGRLREFKKLSVSWETQGNSNFYEKENWKTQGNVEYSMWHSRQQKCIPANYSLWNCSGKV